MQIHSERTPKGEGTDFLEDLHKKHSEFVGTMKTLSSYLKFYIKEIFGRGNCFLHRRAWRINEPFIS